MPTLNKWDILSHPAIDWKPHVGQLVVAENPCRHKVLAAGRRFGKSYMGGADKLLPEVFFTRPIANQLLLDGKKRVFWIVGPNFSDSEKEFRVIWNYLKKLEIPMNKPSYNNPETGDMIITLWDGAMQIIAKSAQNPERLVGEGLSGVILSEAAKLKENIWPKYIRPTLADFNGWSFASSTPEGKNWFYELWRNGQDPNNEAWASWRMPAWINNYVYKHPTNEEHVHKLLELSRQTNESVFKLAKKHEFQIDPEILDSINELTPEAFLQEIAADFCADEETEILTQRGWLRYNEVQVGDQTLGMKMDGTVEWTNINRVNIFEAKHRRMVKMVQRAHDSLTTKDHRWLVERVDLNHSCMFKERKFTISEQLGKSNERIICARPVTNLPETPKYTDALVELVAWYWTEGHLREKDKNSIDIAQDRTVNSRKWKSIEAALISEFGPRSGRISGGDGWTVHVGHNSFHLRGEFASAISQFAPGKDKKLDYGFITSLTKSQLKLFIDTSIAGDGWLKHNPQSAWGRTHGAEIAQKKCHNLDVLQFACQLYGLQTTLTYHERVNQWWLRIFEKNSFYPVSAKRSGKLTEIDYFGKVWCPSTNTSTWLARRNGTVYFTGNTEFVGRVFKEFDEEKHVTDLEFNPGWQTFAAVDYGYCVDTETEILTKDGWKRYDEIGYGTECLTLNTETHLAEWGNVKDVKVFDGQWDMVRMKSKSHDSFTTTNHRWFTKWIGNQKNWNWRWTTSDSFKDNDYIPTALPVSNLPETPKYTDVLVELVAWYWTEGSRWSKGVGNHKGSLLGGEITQNFGHQSAKIKRALISLYGDSDKAGMRQRIPKWHYAFDDRKDFGGAFKLNGPALAPILEHVRGYDKIVSPEFVAAFTRSQLELFINTSIEADGAKTGASYIISQAKWQRLEPLQMACQLAGIQTVLRKRDDGYGSLTLFERYNQFNPKRIARQEKWTGRVWCPTTNNGTWLARRNGTVYFTGNCNPNVWLIIQEGPWGEINVLDEIYEEGLDPEDFADEIRWRRLNPANLRYFFPDPADPGASRILEKRLGIKAAGGTGGELNSRINHIRKALREPRHEVEDLYVQNLPPGQIRPRLLFDRRCKRTIEDMLAYRYPEKKVESETSTKRFDSPMKKDDHGPEALGRYFAGRLGQFGKGTGATIHKATFNSKHKEKPVDHRRATKSSEYLRPAAHEKRREDFPIVNDALGNYLSGAYDD